MQILSIRLIPAIPNGQIENNRIILPPSHEPLLIEIQTITIIRLATPNRERNAEGGSLIETAIGLLHLRLVQLVFRKDDFLQMLDDVHTALIPLRLGRDPEGRPLQLETLRERQPLLLLPHQRGREVELVGVAWMAIRLRDCAIDLKLRYRVCEGEDFFEVKVRLAELCVSEAFDILQKINLVFQLHSQDLLLQGFDNAQGDKHRCYLLLGYNEIPDSLGKIQRKIVKEQSQEPLKDPQLIHQANLPQFHINLRQFPLEQDPKDLTVQLSQRKAILIQPNRQDPIMRQQPDQQSKTLLLLTARKQQETTDEVQALRVTHMREVKGHPSQNFLKSVKVLLIPEETRLRIRPSGILSYLLETGMDLGQLLGPR